MTKSIYAKSWRFRNAITCVCSEAVIRRREGLAWRSPTATKKELTEWEGNK